MSLDVARRLDAALVGVSARSDHDERPVEHADRTASRIAASMASADRRRLAFHPTPASVARFMAGLLRTRSGLVRLLDPAAGTGTLACAAVERFAEALPRPVALHLVCYEVDPRLAGACRASLDHARIWAHGRGLQVTFEVVEADFAAAGVPAGFDAAIGNPPYFKIGAGHPWRAAAPHTNAYAVFMDLAAARLAEGGDLVFITPRSFASGPYFRGLRRRLLAAVRPRRFHLFRARDEAFDGVLQETVVFAATREDGWRTDLDGPAVAVTASVGAADLDRPHELSLPFREALAGSDVILLPASADELAVVRRMRRWPETLASLGLSASTGSVVAHRRAELLVGNADGRALSPLLWLGNVAPMRIDWPLDGRPQRIALDEGVKGVAARSGPCVLLWRFSDKDGARRVVAAPYLSSEPAAFENHLNVVRKDSGVLSPVEAVGLAAFYCSGPVDRWMRAASGTTQVNAADLRAMPMPDWATLRRIGEVTSAAGGGIAAAESAAAASLEPDRAVA